MARGTWLFWALIAVLLGASAFFALGAERQRKAALAGQASLRSGDVVRFVSVIDGDAVVAVREDGEQAAVRVLAYTAYPFPALPMYLQAQEQARAERAGLWSNPEVVARADALLAEWRGASP
ncbi:hypothetical protein [Sorangium sp. So ce233]|uniref:hypothetical protein n=1 Tax=Sorangium sp. So ce233 TaxID=3133290 RepID=UPI003F5FEC20